MNESSGFLNEALHLHLVERFSQSCPSQPEDVGEALVRHGNRAAIQRIAGRRKPAGQALLKPMARRAESGL